MIVPNTRTSFDQLQQTAKNLTTRQTNVHLQPVCRAADGGTSRHGHNGYEWMTGFSLFLPLAGILWHQHNPCDS